MLWNSIYEFFVEHIFGGALYRNNTLVRFNAILGAGYDGAGWQTLSTDLARSGIVIKVNNIDYNMPLGNYLSMISTIIFISIIFILCCLFIHKLVRIVAGLMTHR